MKLKSLSPLAISLLGLVTGCPAPKPLQPDKLSNNPIQLLSLQAPSATQPLGIFLKPTSCLSRSGTQAKLNGEGVELQDAAPNWISDNPDCLFVAAVFAKPGAALPDTLDLALSDSSQTDEVKLGAWSLQGKQPSLVTADASPALHPGDTVTISLDGLPLSANVDGPALRYLSATAPTADGGTALDGGQQEFRPEVWNVPLTSSGSNWAALVPASCGQSSGELVADFTFSLPSPVVCSNFTNGCNFQDPTAASAQLRFDDVPCS